MRNITGGASSRPACSACEDGDVLVTPLPLFHSNALNTFYQALLYGAHVVYLPRFSVSGFFGELADRMARR